MLTEPRRLQVFYDGACPVCRREIAFYRRRRDGAGIDWIDLSVSPPETLPPAIDRDAALERLHVIAADGRRVVGAQAFPEIWRTLSGFRTLAIVARWRAARPLLELSYAVFLRIRAGRRARIR